MLEVRFFIKDHMEVPEVIMTWERGRMTSRRWKMVIDQAFFMVGTYGIDADLILIEIRTSGQLRHIVTAKTVQVFANIDTYFYYRSECIRHMNLAN